MKASPTTVDAEVRRLRRKAESLGEDQGAAFARLLDSLVEIFGRQVAEVNAAVLTLESKLDSHISTLRTDISHVRQQAKAATEALESLGRGA